MGAEGMNISPVSCEVIERLGFLLNLHPRM